MPRSTNVSVRSSPQRRQTQVTTSAPRTRSPGPGPVPAPEVESVGSRRLIRESPYVVETASSSQRLDVDPAAARRFDLGKGGPHLGHEVGHEDEHLVRLRRRKCAGPTIGMSVPAIRRPHLRGGCVDDRRQQRGVDTGANEQRDGARRGSVADDAAAGCARRNEPVAYDARRATASRPGAVRRSRDRQTPAFRSRPGARPPSRPARSSVLGTPRREQHRAAVEVELPALGAARSPARASMLESAVVE